MSTEPRFRGVSTFVLKVISDALLIVDSKQVLFGNKSFENLCDYAAFELSPSPALLLQDESERRAFFQLVDDHISGKRDVYNESIVECNNRSSGLFLARVTFHAFLDELDDNKPKCVCIFSDPIFFKSLFTNNSTLLGLLEYRAEECDCIMLKTNQALLNTLSLTTSVNNLSSQSAAPPPALSSPSLLFTVKKRLVAELGFTLTLDDFTFFEQCRLQSAPRSTRFRVQQAAQLPDSPDAVYTFPPYIHRAHARMHACTH